MQDAGQGLPWQRGFWAMSKRSKLIHNVSVPQLYFLLFLPSHLAFSFLFISVLPITCSLWFVTICAQFLAVHLDDTLPLQQADSMCLPILCLFTTLPSPSWMYVLPLTWRATAVSLSVVVQFLWSLSLMKHGNEYSNKMHIAPHCFLLVSVILEHTLC